MISRTIKKTVELTKAQKLDQLDGPLYQLENGGHTFEITCMENGVPVAVTGTVTARFLRPDGETETFTGTKSGAVIYVTLAQRCYELSGRYTLTIFVTNGNTISAVYAVAGSVYRSTSGTEVVPSGTVPNLDTLLSYINACNTAATNATNAAAFVPNIIAPAYASGTAYSAGDYFTDSGKLYKVAASITAANNTAISKVSKNQVTVGSELLGIINNIPIATVSEIETYLGF